MNTKQVIDEVSPLIGTRWGYQDDYAAFIGPKCAICSLRACTSPACLADIRGQVAAVLTVGDLSAVLCGEPDLSPSAAEVAGEEPGGVTDAF